MKPSQISRALGKSHKSYSRIAGGVARDVNATRKSPAELASLFESLLDDLDKRELRILFLRNFCIFPAQTLQELGDYFGVSRERIRIVESTCIKVIKDRLKIARFRPLVEAAETIGLAVPINAPEAAGLCGISGESIERKNCASFLRGFLFWLRGSYELKDGWVIRRPANQLIWKTRRIAKSLLRGGPVSIEELIEKVRDLGFSKDIGRQWVSTFGQVRVFGSVAIQWEGSLADKAAAILEFQGQPMRKGRISKLLGTDHCIRTLSNYLHTDKRFKRLGIDLFGLSRWGGKEYRTIADTIENIIHANGGEATVTEIISQVLAHNASESSIRKYLHGPRFQRLDSGSYRVR